MALGKNPTDEEIEAHLRAVGTVVTPEMVIASRATQRKRKASRAELERNIRKILSAVDFANSKWNQKERNVVHSLFDWGSLRDLL